MTTPTVLLSLLIGTATVTTVALAVSWEHFGRRRHVLTWMASYVVAIFQWISNCFYFALGNSFFLMLTGIGFIISAYLLALGIQQRSGRPFSHAAFAVPAIVAALCVVIVFGPITSPALQVMVAPAYIGILLAISAASLLQDDRRMTPPEIAFFSALVLLAISQIALAVAGTLVNGTEDSKAVYRAIQTLLFPTIYVGTAISAILVVAGDLAADLVREMRRDPLTDVLNRRGVDEAATSAIAQAQRHGRPLSLVLCDLDGFKRLNDDHGHIAGDDALRCFAQLLTVSVRRGDIVWRMGGDEFGLLLLDTKAEAAAEVMERVRNDIADICLPKVSGHQLGASFGVATLAEGDLTLEDLVARADRALYMSKRQGKNRVSIVHADAA